MIDKDQKPIVLAMLKTVYTPIILRSIINLVILDISQIMFYAKTKQESRKIMHSDECLNALLTSLEINHKPRKGDLIQEILRQYQLHLNKDETDFYHQYMGQIFDVQLDHVRDLLNAKNYAHLYNLSHVSTH